MTRTAINGRILVQNGARTGHSSDQARATAIFKAYVYSSAAVVAVIGVMMLRAAGVRMLVTQQPDAVSGLAIPTVLVAGGILHLLVGGCVFALRNLMNQAIMLLWLGLNCFVYRAGLAWTDAVTPPPLVQAVGMKFEIWPAALDLRWKWFLAWLVIGSLIVLVCEWRRLRRLAAESFMKQWREKRVRESDQSASFNKSRREQLP